MTQQPPEPQIRGGIHVGDVAGNATFSALGDIVAGDQIINITTIVQIAVETVKTRPLNVNSPYRGLDRFETRDSGLFFGRERSVKSLIARLGHSSILLVLGASGSGKSSLVRAGVLPVVTEVFGNRLRYLVFVPDQDPFEALRSSLVAAEVPQSEARPVLKEEPAAIAQRVRRLKRGGDLWLLFIDQFEELFTRTPESLRGRFLDTLLLLAREDDSVKIVLAMRADFLDRLSGFPEFSKRVQNEIELVADMGVDELRLVIEQPAAQHGVVLEDGLVEEILKNVTGQAGTLPLLEYTLDLLWTEEREKGLDGRTLRARTYRELGGVHGALHKRAEALYRDLAAPEGMPESASKQSIARRVFLRLVDVAPSAGSANAPWKPVRRRVALSSFSAPEQEVVHFLVDNKLLVSDRGSILTAAHARVEAGEATIEVAHEALFGCWERLQAWIADAQPVIATKNRLSDDAARYERMLAVGSPNAGDELWSGSRLSNALERRAKGDFSTLIGGLSDSENRFLDRSAGERESRRRAEEKRQHQVATGLAIGLLLALVLLGVAAFEWRTAKQKEQEARASEGKAKEQAEIARQQTVIAQQEKQATLAHHLSREAEARYGLSAKSLTISTLLAGKSLASSWTADGYRMLLDRRELLPPRPEKTWRAHQQPIKGFALSSDRAWLATSDGAEVAIWDVEASRRAPDETGVQVFHVDAANARIRTNHVLAVAFSPDRKWLAIGSEPKVCVWNLTTRDPKPIEVGMANAGYVMALAFSLDNRTLLVGGRQIQLVPVGGDWSRVNAVPTADRFQVTRGLAVHASGYVAATPSWQGTVEFFDLKAGRSHPRPQTLDNAGNGIAFSPDGRLLATSQGDDVFVALASAQEPFRWKGRISADRSSAFDSIDFSHDGQYLVVTPSGGVWSLSEKPSPKRPALVEPAPRWNETRPTYPAIGAEVMRLDDVSFAKFAADDRLLCALDGSISVHALDASRREVAHIRADDMLAMAVSADGQRLATSSCDDGYQVRFWGMPGLNLLKVAKTKQGEQVQCAQLAGNEVALMMSADGQVAAADNGTTALIASIAEERFIQEIDIGDQPSLLALRADGKAIAVATEETLEVIDLGAPLRRRPMKLESGNPMPTALGFSPDGRFVVERRSGGGCDRYAGFEATLLTLWDATSGTRVAWQSIEDQEKTEINCPKGFAKDQKLGRSGDVSLLAQARSWRLSSDTETKITTADRRFHASSHQANAIDTTTAREVDLLPDRQIDAYAMGAPGRWLVTADQEKRDPWTHRPSAGEIIRVWPLSTDDILRDTCARLRRNLTRDEWRTAVGDTPYSETCKGLPSDRVDAPEPPMPGEAVPAEALQAEGQ